MNLPTPAKATLYDGIVNAGDILAKLVQSCEEILYEWSK